MTDVVTDSFCFAGVGLVMVGLWLLSPPLVAVFAGAVCLAVGLAPWLKRRP